MTTSRSTPLRMHKRILQFNQLVFRFGWISDPAYSASFKGESISYTNNEHGSYYPTFGQFGRLNSTSFTVNVEIDFKDIDCEDRLRYARYIKRQLAQSGKLWATQNGGELIWTNARVVSIGETIDVMAETDRLRLSLAFELIDGYWRMAKKTRTFICENYCPNRFRDFDQYYCYDVNELGGQCDETGASRCYPCLANLYKPPKIIGCYDTNTPYNNRQDIPYHPLCFYTQKDLQEMFSKSCPNEYYIDYNLTNEQEYFCFDGSWGNKYRLSSTGVNNSTIVSFCSKTDLPTSFVRIRLAGSFRYPEIRQLKPDYDYEELQKIGAITKGEQVPDRYVQDYLKFTGPTNTPWQLYKVITYGYGIKTYTSQNMLNPDGLIPEPDDPAEYKKWLKTYSTIIGGIETEQSNTPAFQIMPGINYFEISGNQLDADSFVYIDPIEITY